MAVSKNPKHPDFTGLGVLVDGVVDAHGAARTPAFLGWVTERQKERANILKQRRLYEEEAKKDIRKDKGDGKGKKGKTGKKGDTDKDADG